MDIKLQIELVYNLDWFIIHVLKLSGSDLKNKYYILYIHNS